jgi:hypothetical protein
MTVEMNWKDVEGSCQDLIWGNIMALAWWDIGTEETQKKSGRIVTVQAKIRTRHLPLEPACSVVNSEHAIIWKEECCLAKILSWYLLRVIE